MEFQDDREELKRSTIGGRRVSIAHEPTFHDDESGPPVNFRPSKESQESKFSSSLQDSETDMIKASNHSHWCYKRTVDYAILILVFLFLLVTLVGYVLILWMPAADTGQVGTDNISFNGYVPMPNLNKTVLDYNVTTDTGSGNETTSFRDFFMACAYEDGADRLKFSCTQMDKHFILKDPN